MCSYYFSSVLVAEWPPFEKELFTRLTLGSLFILTIRNCSYFPFWFSGMDFGSDCFCSWSLHTLCPIKLYVKGMFYDYLVDVISIYHAYLSRVMRNPTFCICEIKDADQLRGCFRYIDSTIPLLSNSEISSL